MKKIIAIALLTIVTNCAYAVDFIVAKNIHYSNIEAKLKELHSRYNVIRWEIVIAEKGCRFFHIIVEVSDDRG